MIAAIATLAYCLCAWFLCNAAGTRGENPVSGLIEICTWLAQPLSLPTPINAAHWQLLALMSLAYAQLSAAIDDVIRHYGVLLFLLLLNLIGVSALVLS